MPPPRPPRRSTSDRNSYLAIIFIRLLFVSIGPAALFVTSFPLLCVSLRGRPYHAAQGTKWRMNSEQQKEEKNHDFLSNSTLVKWSRSREHRSELMNFYETFILNFPFRCLIHPDEFAAIYSQFFSPSRSHFGRTKSINSNERFFSASKLFNFFLASGEEKFNFQQFTLVNCKNFRRSAIFRMESLTLPLCIGVVI